MQEAVILLRTTLMVFKSASKRMNFLFLLQLHQIKSSILSQLKYTCLKERLMQTKDLKLTKKKEKYFTYLLVIAILLIASTLRSPITSVSPLIPTIREDLLASNVLIGTITTLPFIAFGIFSPFIPWLAGKWGMERTLLLAMTILAISVFMRTFAGVPLLLVGTLLTGGAIAAGNVLMPGLIQSNFPQKIGLMTGIYSVCMNFFGALASGIAVPLADLPIMSWRSSLQIWSSIATLAVLVLFLRRPGMSFQRHNFETKVNKNFRGMLRSKTAWAVTLFMGFQSFIPYSLFTWLPDIAIANGYSQTEAGWLVALCQLGLIPTTFILPILAAKVNDQRIYACLSGLIFFIGIFGIRFLDSTYIPLFVFIAGVAAGATFSLAMMFFVLRTTTARQASQLSGMAQTIGYLISACGPVTLGLIADVFASWNASLNILLLVSIGIVGTGFLAGKNTKI